MEELEIQEIKENSNNKEYMLEAVRTRGKFLEFASFNLKDEALEEFKLITKIYFDEKLEKEYKMEGLF